MPDIGSNDESTSQLAKGQAYTVWTDGATYFARDADGAVTSNSNFKTLIQDIINTIPTRDNTVGTHIKLAEGVYDVQSTIEIFDKYNVHISGAGMGLTIIQAGASLGTAEEIFDVKGTSTGTQKSLTANTVERAFTCTMSTGDSATFAANDYVLIRSTVNFAAGASASGHQGEIKKIASVDTGTGIITFKEPLHDVYLTASSANVIKLNLSQNISFSNFTLDKDVSYAAHNDNVWWRMWFVDRLSIDRCEVVDFTGTNSGAMWMISCLNAKVSNCHIQTNIAYNTQYGINFSGACENCLVTNCTAFGNHRHPFEMANGIVATDMQGASRNIHCTNCVAIGGDGEQFHCHPEGDGITFSNCGVSGKLADGGFRCRARRSTISNCWVRDGGPNGGSIVLSDDAFDSIITNCWIKNGGEAGIRINDGLDGTLIQGCVIDNCVLTGIDLSSGCDNTKITDCIIKNNDGDGIDVNNSDNCVFANNIVKDNGGFGLDFTSANCTNETIIGNQFTGNASGSVADANQIGNFERDNLGYFTHPDIDPYSTKGEGSNTKRWGAWMGNQATSGVGLLATDLTAIGTPTDAVSTAEGIGVSFATGAVANANAGLRQTNNFFRREWGCYIKLRCDFSSTSDIRVFIGFSSDTAEIAGETTLNNFSGVGIGKRTADTNWFTYRNDGDATEDRTDTGVVFSTVARTIEIQLNATNFKSRLGGAMNATETTELPASATNLHFHAQIETGAGAATKTLTLYPIYVCSGELIL